MQGSLIAAWRRAPGKLLAALALALATQQAGALEMGEPDVRSALGEVLDVRITLTPADGESLDAGCFTLLRGTADAAPPTLGEGILTIDLRDARPTLRVRSTARILEPAIALHLRFACAGQSVERKARFAVLLDPRPGSELVTSIPTIAATMTAAPGDTLASFAGRVFPQERAARAQYLTALREANPAFGKQGDNEALPDRAQVALPDLRTYAQATREPAKSERKGEAKAAATKPAPKRLSGPKNAAPDPVATKPVETKAPAPKPLETRAATKPDTRQAQARKTAQPHSGSPFVLKLSSADVDMSRTRGIDDRMRAQLRERLLVLDADDQVAALLSLRNSVKQLESRVAELQLKLATVPPVLAATPGAAGAKAQAPKAAPATGRAEAGRVEAAKAEAAKVEAAKAEAAKAEAAKVEAAKVEAAKVEAAKVEAAKVEAAKVEAAKVEAAKLEAAKVEAAKLEAAKIEAAKVEAAKVEAAKVEAAKVEAAKVEAARAEAAKVETANVQTATALELKAEPPRHVPAKPATKPAPTPMSATSSSWVDGVPNMWLIGGLVGLLALLAALAFWNGRRRELNRADDPDREPTMTGELRPAERAFDDDNELTVAAVTPPEPRTAVRPALASDAGLSTRLGENSRELRRRYIEERFPEIANRNLVLEDTASVVKGARLFYEDGALPRAVELLQFCIEDNPQEVRTWLALFEIFRLERLSGEFGDLARRFHQHHGNSDYWRKVQYFGREIDPDNLLYREDTINTLETIGPAQARQLAAASFDPIAENWLDAPMDFENQVLANELRQALMAQANLSEGDLIPNPMPALRNIEMFTVA